MKFRYMSSQIIKIELTESKMEEPIIVSFNPIDNKILIEGYRDSMLITYETLKEIISQIEEKQGI